MTAILYSGKQSILPSTLKHKQTVPISHYLKIGTVCLSDSYNYSKPSLEAFIALICICMSRIPAKSFV